MTKKNKDKQRSIKQYTENIRSSNMNLTKNRGWTLVLRKGNTRRVNVKRH